MISIAVSPCSCTIPTPLTRETGSDICAAAKPERNPASDMTAIRANFKTKCGKGFLR
jgi:hypothetical protein